MVFIIVICRLWAFVGFCGTFTDPMACSGTPLFTGAGELKPTQWWVMTIPSWVQKACRDIQIPTVPFVRVHCYCQNQSDSLACSLVDKKTIAPGILKTTTTAKLLTNIIYNEETKLQQLSTTILLLQVTWTHWDLWHKNDGDFLR